MLVVSDDLPVLAAAWTASRLALHQRLTFYDARPAALIAAHSMVLVSRPADVAIFGAVALIRRATGVLLAVGVVLRSAQLPFPAC